MRASPSIAPQGRVQDRYIVLDFGGILGSSWRETDADSADRKTLIDLMEGQFDHSVRIIAFNTAEGWSREVTEDIADEPRRRDVEDEMTNSLLAFMEAHVRR